MTRRLQGQRILTTVVPWSDTAQPYRLRFVVGRYAVRAVLVRVSASWTWSEFLLSPSRVAGWRKPRPKSPDLGLSTTAH